MKYTRIELATIEQYAPPMPEGTEERITIRTLDNIRAKYKPRVYHGCRRALTTACVVLTLAVCMVVANAAFDLTAIYEPFLGERGAQYLQGIDKTDVNEGIELTVEAAYTDDESVELFYTLTDTEGKGRIINDVRLDCDLNSWLMSLSGGGGSSSHEPLEIAPDGNRGWFHYSMEKNSGIASGQLMTFKLSDLKMRMYTVEHEIDIDLAAYITSNPNPLIVQENPDGTETSLANSGLDILMYDGRTRLMNVGFVDERFAVLVKCEEILLPNGSVEVKYPNLKLTDGITEIYADTGHGSSGLSYDIFGGITNPEQLEGFRLVSYEDKYEDEIDGEWSVKFRLNKGFSARPYKLNATTADGSITVDTVTVTPTSVTLRGMADWNAYEQHISSGFTDNYFELVSASGQEIQTFGGSSSGGYSESSDYNPFTCRLTGIIPDDITAIRIDGVEYSLQQQL